MKISIELQQPFPNFFLFPSGILAPNPGKVRRQFPAVFESPAGLRRPHQFLHPFPSKAFL